MTLVNWLTSADARNKEKMEKNEVNRINHNVPEHVAAEEVKLVSTLYNHASSPLIYM